MSTIGTNLAEYITAVLVILAATQADLNICFIKPTHNSSLPYSLVPRPQSKEIFQVGHGHKVDYQQYCYTLQYCVRNEMKF